METGKVLNVVFPSGRPISFTKVRISLRTGQPFDALRLLMACGRQDKGTTR